MKKWIGVDLHPDSFTVCGIWEDGSERFGSYRINPRDMESFKRTLSNIDEVAVEATANSSWFRRQVQDYVKRVATVQTRDFKVIHKSVKKTDRNDSKNLAFYLKKDMLPEIRIKTKEQEELLSLLQSRDMISKQKTSYLNKIHAVFVRNGEKLKKAGLSSNKKLNALDLKKFSISEKVEIKVLRDNTFTIKKSIREIEKEIKRVASGMDGFVSLMSITGVGLITAATVLAIIGDVRDFKSRKKINAFSGLIPIQSESNGKTHFGPITKRGDKLLRTVLVQCGLSAKRYSPFLKEYHAGIKRRRGSGKANVALARKMLGIIYDTLKYKWVFTDFAAYEKVSLSEVAH